MKNFDSLACANHNGSMEDRKNQVYYTVDMIDKICQRVANGEYIYEICVGEDMPTKATFYNWLSTIPAVSQKYESARLKRLELKEEMLIEMLSADNPSKEKLKQLELRIKLDQWYMERLNPTKYADKKVIRGDKDNPIEIRLSSTLDQRIASRKARQIDHIPSDSALPVIDADSVEIE